MNKKTRLVFLLILTAAFALIATRVTVSAQRGGAVSAPPQPAADGTVPINVTKRVFDKKALLSAPVLTDQQQAGRALFMQRCAYCHDGLGQPSYHTMGDWIGGETVQSLGEDAFKAFVNTGTQRMPTFQYDLNAEQLNSLIAFIKTIPSSAKPTAAQLAGKVAAADGSDKTD